MPACLSRVRLEEQGDSAAREVCRSASHLRTTLHALPIGVLTFRQDGEVVFGNERLARMLQVRPAMLQPAASLLDVLSASAVLPDAAAHRIHTACLDAINIGAGHDGILTVDCGSERPALHVRIMALAEGQWLATLEEAVAEHNGATPAGIDRITGLPDRDVWRRQAASAVARQNSEAQHAVLLVNVDRFRSVNDTLGRAIGDGLLRLVAKRLRSVLRQDDRLTRLEADEFAILLMPPQEKETLAQLAERVVDVLGRPYLVDGQLVSVGASVGVALGPADGHDDAALLRNAELALRSARATGRSKYAFFCPEMDARAASRRALEADLRKALALGEFEIYYQPQVELSSNVVLGFEALLRWHNPDRGLTSPADFIPLAEEIGLIMPLGEWVLREACREAMRWPGGMSVAVNVSPYQFQDGARLVAGVAEALASSGLPSHRLELEITESALLGREQAVLAALHQLRSTGVCVAMDDFGTGYSSLAQLQSFPFDRLKIDRSFVRDGNDEPSQNAVLRAITALATALGMSTVAEGVESAAQLARVQAAGCHSVQGYLFSRPVPANQIGELVAALAGRAPA